MALDRFGDTAEDTGDDLPEHDPRCRDGWLGTDHDGRPEPCLRCRPHLARGTVRVNDYTSDRRL